MTTKKRSTSTKPKKLWTIKYCSYAKEIRLDPVITSSKAEAERSACPDCKVVPYIKRVKRKARK